MVVVIIHFHVTVVVGLPLHHRSDIRMTTMTPPLMYLVTTMTPPLMYHPIVIVIIWKKKRMVTNLFHGGYRTAKTTMQARFDNIFHEITFPTTRHRLQEDPRLRNNNVVRLLLIQPKRHNFILLLVLLDRERYLWMWWMTNLLPCVVTWMVAVEYYRRHYARHVSLMNGVCAGKWALPGSWPRHLVLPKSLNSTTQLLPIFQLEENIDFWNWILGKRHFCRVHNRVALYIHLFVSLDC
jgi:hypothetical protein